MIALKAKDVMSRRVLLARDDMTLEELASPSKAALEAAMDGHVVTSAVLMGTYERIKGKDPAAK